jgi:hypothetical protein
VVGVIFFHPVKKLFAPAAGRLRTIDGDEFAAKTVQFGDPSISLTTVGGQSFQIALSRFRDLEMGQTRFAVVSKLKPASLEWTPLVPNPETIEFQRILNRPRFDTSFESKPLQLKFAASDRSWSSYQLVEYANGIAARAGTRIVFEIDGKYSRLTGVAGFSPGLVVRGSADFVVTGDGNELFRTTLDASRNDPVPFAIDLNHSQRMIIQIDYHDGTGFGGVIHLCDLKLEREERR